MTDTNQASEDELMRELRLLYGRRVSSNLSLAEYFLEMRQLIRNEKLKLLAEVRMHAEGLYSRPGSNAIIIEAIPLTDLDKLEAEL